MYISVRSSEGRVARGQGFDALRGLMAWRSALYACARRVLEVRVEGRLSFFGVCI